MRISTYPAYGDTYINGRPDARVEQVGFQEDLPVRNVEILKQPQYSPVPVEKQVAIIYLGTQGLLRDVPVRKVKEFEEHFIMEMENKLPDVLTAFKKGALPEDGIQKMVELAKSLIPQYK